MGDLNLEPQHGSIKYLASKMKDAHTLAGDFAFGPEGTFNGFNFGEPVNRRIDYIFTSKAGLELVKYTILSDPKDCRYPSDHLPVYARISFQ